MRQDDLSLKTLPVLSMVAGNRNVGEFEQPRIGKPHGEIDVGLPSGTSVRLVGAKNVRQDLELHVVDMTLSGTVLSKWRVEGVRIK